MKAFFNYSMLRQTPYRRHTPHLQLASKHSCAMALTIKRGTQVNGRIAGESIILANPIFLNHLLTKERSFIIGGEVNHVICVRENR